MSEEKKTNSKFEAAISDLLDGDMRKNALDFVADLHENGISITSATNGAWKITYKNKGLGRVIWMKRNFYAIETYRDDSKEFENFIKNENLQEIMWNNLYKCRGCNPKKCAPQANKAVDGFTGYHKTYFGKEFENTCKHWQGGTFRTPDAKTLECIKRVLDYKKQIIINNG